jgi:ADP-ribosyl-[dinitrogen reductase] hydrolase
VGEITAYTLFERGVLRVGWHPRLDRAPSPLPPDICLADKIEGMLLGLAIGDALGNTSESMGIDLRRRRYGWIDHYLPNHCAEGRRVGLPSDDSQLAFRAVMQLVEHGKLVPQDLGCLIASGGIFGMGAATAAFVQRFNAGMPWERSGSPRASNGARMRIALVLLPFVLEPSESLWHDTLRAAHLTHDDAVSNASCVALVHLLWKAIGMTRAPDAGWWIDEWLQVCDDLCLDERLRSRRPDPPIFEGTLQQLVRSQVLPALDEGSPTDEACNRWYSGAYLLETVPSLLYILARHADDPQQAILEAVNHTHDNDTIAAIVGAVVGALHGASALPAAWVDDLSGRTAEDDDHRMFVLMREAAMRFRHGIGPVLSRQIQRRAIGERKQ